MRDDGPPAARRSGDVVLGEDWVAPDSTVETELRARRARRGLLSLKTSPLTRKIITFNLIALSLLVAGILYLNASRDSLLTQRAGTLVGEAELIADVFEVQLPAGAPVSLATGDGVAPAETLEQLTLRDGLTVFLFDTAGNLIAQTTGAGRSAMQTSLSGRDAHRTVISNALAQILERLGRLTGQEPSAVAPSLEEQLRALVLSAAGGTQVRTGLDTLGGRVISAAAPIMQGDRAVGIVAVASASGEIDAVVREERERVLQMFVIATLVSIGLSLVLASTIAHPLADLAEAAEMGRARNSRSNNPGRIRIPDLTARPDEIGRLSGALRGMVAALYSRIDSNEQFAADVAHEIKNPLASLRSAIGTLRMVRREDQRDKLLDVIEHDVRRLDRLVSDISNASRLDSELVKEEQISFDLLQMLSNITDHLSEQARERGIEFITDMPRGPIRIRGLEGRLAQVFVNLISNAISFCEEGDAIRIWARQRENRVLVVVEDTGPGIPEEALTKIFKRFYSQRPPEHFGNNSGLGLAISKQIVEAHGGVIWAENIRPTEADVSSDPLGARFVVGLPV